MVRGRELLNERGELLALLRRAEPWPLIAFLLLGLLIVALSPVIALLTAGLVEGVQDDGGLASGSLVLDATLLALAIIGLQQALGLKDALVERVAASIDGNIRSRVRYVASNVLPFDVVEGTDFQADAVRACDPGEWWRSRTAGLAATGQVWLMFRILATFVLAVPLFTISPLLAGIVTVGAFWIRSLVRKHWVNHARIADVGAPVARDAELVERSFFEPRFAREFAVFGFAPWLTERWRRLDEEAHGPAKRLMKEILRKQWLPALVSFGVGVLAFGILGFDILNGRLSAAEVTFALVSVVRILGTMAPMGFEAWDIDYGLAAVQAMKRIEQQARATVVGARPDTTVADVPIVDMSDVVFAFDPSRPVLDGVTLRIEPGERLALVGRNGAGKSTLTKLVSGLYSPLAGSVSFDGIPTSEPEGRALATASVAVMHQESLRLPLDVRGNVTMGAEADDDEVWNALDVAGLADALRKDRVELATPLWNARGERRDLSGGQWQRIALARAVFAAGRGKRILLLDEPTSQFDVYGEARFYEEVMSVLSTASVVLITHRLSTIRRADRIAMLDGGRIVEAGSHDELMQRDGQYAAMFRVQASRFRERGS